MTRPGRQRCPLIRVELGTCAWSGGPAGLREPEGDGISGLAQAGLLRAAAPEICYLWEGPARGVGRGAGPARGMSHPRPGQWEQTGGSGRERPSAPSDLLVFIPQALHVGAAEPRRRSSGLRTWTAGLESHLRPFLVLGQASCGVQVRS